jgi:hypothetical protein
MVSLISLQQLLYQESAALWRDVHIIWGLVPSVLFSLLFAAVVVVIINIISTS